MEWKSEQINEIATALSKAQGQFEGAVADSDNPFFKSKYADLKSVWEAVKEPLSSNGLSIVQLPIDEAEGQKITIMTILMHCSGQWLSSRITLPAVKNDPQAYGSAYTYARRYALQALLCIPTVDDDGEGAMQRNKKVKHEPVQPRPVKPQPQDPDAGTKPMSEQQRKKLWAMLMGAGLNRDEAKEFVGWAGIVTSKAASEAFDNMESLVSEFKQGSRE